MNQNVSAGLYFFEFMDIGTHEHPVKQLSKIFNKKKKDKDKEKTLLKFLGFFYFLKFIKYDKKIYFMIDLKR